MTGKETDVDGLYQLPLADFTSERDALAKAAGAAGARIRTLQKATAPAWAVNQLYWRRRKTFDRLVTMTERLRKAHAQRLSGKSADVGLAEAAHQAALRTAILEASNLLRDAGHSVTPPTLIAITETLEALPWTETVGRLTRAVRPAGFGALVGLLPAGGAVPKRLAEIVSIDRATRAGASAVAKAEHAEREAGVRRREAAEIERQLRRVRADERAAGATTARARAALDRAVTERDRLSANAEKAAARVQQLRDELGRRAKQMANTSAERARLEQRLKALSTAP